jgi:hypothetical protein
MTPEQELRVEIAQSLIEQGEVLFSAQAWKFFQRHGRGYLYLHKVIKIQCWGRNNCSINEQDSALGNRMHYVAKGSRAWMMMTLSQSAKEQPLEYGQFMHMIDTYNPKREYVVIIGFNYGVDVTEHWFLRRPEMNPPQAFMAVRRQPQEFGVDSI